MNTKLREKYKNAETDNLIKIAFVDNTDYEAEAVEIAMKELLSRGITSKSDIVSEIVSEKSQEQIKQIEEVRIRDTEPLEADSKVFFFICGFIPIPLLQFIILVFLIPRKRGKRKRRESWKWFLFGLGFIYSLLFLLAVIKWIL